MSGQIRMTPEQLKAKAKHYEQSAQQIDDILRNLRNLKSCVDNGKDALLNSSTYSSEN